MIGKGQVSRTARVSWSLAVGLILAAALLWLLPQSAQAQVNPRHDVSPGRLVESAQAEAVEDSGGPTIMGNPLPPEPHLRLEKNADYHAAAGVAITEATSLFISQDEAWTRYQSGTLDSIAPPEWALGDIKASPTFSPQLTVYPGQCTYYYGFSNDVPPFDDPQVRAAFASAIDRDRLINDTLGGDPLPALTFAPPGTFGYVDGAAEGIGRPYSPTLAVSLLTASGYTGTPTITLAYNENPNHQAIAQAVRQMWIDTLGITVTLKEMPWPDYLDLLNNGSAAERPGVWRMGWCADYPDAHNWHQPLLEGHNRMRYSNPAYEAAVAAAAGESVTATRLDLYKEAEAYLVMTDTAIAPLYTYVNYDLTRPDIVRTHLSYGGQKLADWTISGPLRPLEVVWAEPASLDPAMIYDSASLAYIDQLFLGLTDVDGDGNTVPELAMSWQVSADGLIYTFTLRNDVRWTDGMTVTAGDVEYAVLRALDPATGSDAGQLLFPIDQAQQFYEGTITDPSLVGVEALDDTHLRFTLHSPAAYFPMVAGFWSARPLPQWTINTHGAAWTDPANIVTNGPYKLTSWKQAPYLRIEKWVDGNPGEGGNVVAVIRYYNDGGGEAPDVVITDTLYGLSYLYDTSGFSSSTGPVAGGEYVAFDLGTVAANSQAEFEVYLQVTGVQSDMITNTAQIVTSDPYDQGDPGEKTAWWTGQVQANDTHLNVGQNAWTGDPAPGHDIVFAVNTCNNGSTSSSQVVLTDTLHPSFTLQSWWGQHPGWVEEASSANQLVLSRASVPNWWCGEIYLRATLDPAAWSGMTVSNSAVIAASSDLETYDNQTYWQGNANDPHTNLYLNKGLAWAQLTPDGEIGYGIDFGNNGNVPVSGPIRVTDTLPVSTTFRGSFRPTPQGPDPLTPVLVTADQVVWEFPGLDNGYGDGFVISFEIDPGAIPGTVLTNTAEIAYLPGEDSYGDNRGTVIETVFDHGPNLRVRKWHNWNGDGQLSYNIRLENVGDQPVYSLFITDTYPVSTTFNGNWGHNYWNWMNLNTLPGALVWELPDLDFASGIDIWFSVDLDTPGQPFRWYTNTIVASLHPSDTNPADNDYMDVAFSGGEVNDIGINVFGNRIYVDAPNGPITITTPYGSTSFPWGGHVDWDAPDYIRPGDTVVVAAGAGTHPVTAVVPDPFDVWADSDTDIVWGQVDALDHEWLAVRPDGMAPQWVETDGSGSFSTSFADLPRGTQGNLSYDTQIDYAWVHYNRRFQTNDLIMSANYGHDWVEGDYEVGHTVWLTVTENDRLTIKGTAVLTTGFVPWWGGRTGFSTNWQGWASQPDIQPGDWVFGRVDNGKATEVQMGVISGYIDSASDTITGTVDVGWITQTVRVECHPWDAPGGAPQKSDYIMPDGVDVYACWWDPMTEWDVQPGQNIGVFYPDPSLNWVGNAFREPAPYLTIDKQVNGRPGEGGNATFRISYWNNGDEPAENTVITDTLLGGLVYLEDTSGLPVTVGAIPGGQEAVWELGTLPAYSYGEFEVFCQVTAVASETVTNTARIATSNPKDQGEPWEKERSWSGHVSGNDTHLNVGKSAWTGDPAPDSDFVFAVDVCNNGSTGSSQVVMTDTLGPLMTLQSWWGQHAGWTLVSSNPGQLVVSRPSIPDWWCGEVYLRVHLDGSAVPGTQITNTAVIAADNDLETFDNRSDWGGTSNDPHINPYLRPDWWYGQLVPGGHLVYEMSFGNDGNVPVDDVVFTSTLPAFSSLVSVGHFDRHWNPLGPLTPTMVAPGVVTWGVGTLENGFDGRLLIELEVDPAAPPGTPLTHTVAVGPKPGEDRYDDNTVSWSHLLNPAGPNLYVNKHNYSWQGDSQLSYEIRVKNLGTERLEDVWIVDTYPISTTFNWDWGFNHGPWISMTHDHVGRQLAFQLDGLNPGETASVGFRVDLDGPVVGVRGFYFTNTVEAPWPGDVFPADNTDTVVAFSGPEVDRVEFWFDPPNDPGMWGSAQPGSWVTITTPYTQAVVWADPGCGGCWDTNSVWIGPLQPGDVVEVIAGRGTMPVTIPIPDPLSAEADSSLDTVYGQVGGWLNQPVEIHGNWPDGYQEVWTDGAGNYLATYADIPRGGDGYVRFVSQIDDTQVIFHRSFDTRDLVLEVNYGHDWVEGNYEIGHTIWVTLTESDGLTVKATAVLTSGYVPWWGGQTGFSTNWQGWTGSHPDLVPGDWVYGRVENGRTSQAQIGVVSGLVDVTNDGIEGTVDAGWIGQDVLVDCRPWGGPSEAPSKQDVILPDGVDSYSCWWNPGTEWDVRNGQNLAVFYQEPDGDWVGNVFVGGQLTAQIGPNSGGNRQVWGQGAVPYSPVTVTVWTETSTLVASTTTQADGSGNFHTGDGLPENALATTEEPYHFWNQVVAELGGGITRTMTIYPMGVEADPDTDVITITAAGPPFFGLSLDFWEPGGPGDWIDLGNIGLTGVVTVNLAAERGYDVQPGTHLQANLTIWDDHMLQYATVVPFLHVRVNQSHSWVDGDTTPGQTIAVTVWRDGLPYNAATTSNGGGTSWGVNFGGGPGQQLEVGDLIEVQTSDGLSAIIELIPMNGVVDAAANTISGQISGVPFPATIRGEVWNVDGGTGVDGMTDGAGNYLIDFSPYDVLPGHMIGLWYIRPDGHQVAIVRHGLQLRVDVGEDRVDGETAPDETVWVKIKNSEQVSTTSNDTGQFETYFAGDIVAGDLVEGWTGAVYTSLVVEPVDAAIDEAADRVWGYGPPDNSLNVAVNGDWRWVSTDPSGFFEITWDYDIRAEDELEVEYYYPEGHQTRYRFGPADLSVGKWAPVGQVMPGDVFTYVIDYSNNANGPAVDVVLTDTLPMSVTYLSDTSGLTPVYDPVTHSLVWQLGHLGSHRSGSFELYVQLDPAAPWDRSYQNLIEIGTTSYDRDPGNNWSQTWINPSSPFVDTWVSKEPAGGSPVPGGVIIYRIDYGNSGNRTANNVVMTDTLPAGTTYVTSTFEVGVDGLTQTVGPGMIIWEIGSLAAGESRQFELWLEIDGAAVPGTLLVNQLELGNDDENRARDNWRRLTTPVEPPAADLWLEKDLWADLSSPENEIVFHIVLYNGGTVAAENVLVTDTLPAGMTHLWHSAGSAVALADGLVVWNLGTVPAGASGQLLVGAQISGTIPPGVVFTNTVVAATSTPELDYDNNWVAARLAAPEVIAVPWAGYRPHRIWPGLETTLKGTAKGFGLGAYEWDPGDGSPIISGWVGDPYAIEARHVYNAPAGSVFTATLTVWGAYGWSDSDTYTVQVFTRTHGVEVDVAVDEGLWFVHKSANRYQYLGLPFAEWQNGGSPVAETASAVQAFQVHGHRPGGNLQEDPYVEDVQRGWNALFSYSVLDAMTVQSAGDPDTNGDGAGVGLYGDYNHSIYEAGLAMMALATTGTPDRVAHSGAPIYVRGQTYYSITQNMADWFAWGQNDDWSDWARGGWRYQPNSGDSDNSNTQFPVLGLAAAEDTWGITVPGWVKDELRDYWLATTQNRNGGFGYTSPDDMVNVAKAGAGIMDLIWTGVAVTDTRVVSAATYIETHWNDPPDSINSGGNVGDLYSMYAVKKGSQLADIYAYGPYYWQNIYDAYLVGVQQPDGRFDEDPSLGVWFGSWQPMATSWSLLVLAPGLYEARPVPIIAPVHFGGMGPAWNNGQVIFDASLSHHTDPDREIVLFEWDFGDGSPVFTSTAAIVSHNYPARGVYLARLTVWDDAGLSATRATQVNITAPDTRPVADPGGPYAGLPSQAVVLDGSGSYDPDAWLGDAVTLYEWDIQGGSLYTTTEPTLPFTWTNPGVYSVILRVLDRGQEYGLDSPKWSEPEATQAVVGTLADLALTKADSPDPAVVGGSLTYTITVTNDGPAVATGVVVTDTLPPSVVFASASAGCTHAGQVVTCNLGGLAIGGTKVVNVVVTPQVVKQIVNFAAVASNEVDPDPTDNGDSETTTINPAPIPNPLVTSISPNSGLNTATTPVTILGANFQSGAAASLGSTPLVGVIFVNPNQLQATVPAGMTPGTYKLTVTNPDAKSGSLLNAFTVLAPLPPDVLDVAPSQGPNDRPVTIDVYGGNFAPGLTATLSVTGTIVPLEGILFVDSSHLRAIVPVGITPALYALTVYNPDGLSDELANAYEAVDAIIYDDLYANASDLWLRPASPRQGSGLTPVIGLTVRRQGGAADLTDVAVAFYNGNPAAGGSLIATGSIAVLPPNSAVTTTVEWLPRPTAGTYTLYAVIDPANAVPEQNEANNTETHPVTVLPPVPDTTPPVVTSFSINNGAPSTDVPQVLLNTTASDSGGSGIHSLLFMEYEFDQGIGSWVPIADSGWLPYAAASTDYAWMLRPGAGVRYLQVWAADRAGNISTNVGEQMINLIPAAVRIAQGQIHIFRYQLQAGDALQVRLTSLAGDADLYVWRPNGTLEGYSWAYNPEVIVFTAAMDGVYQIEVEGWTAADYRLEVIPVTGLRGASEQIASPDRGRGWPMVAPGNQPGQDVGLPTAPVGESRIYLPIVVRL